MQNIPRNRPLKIIIVIVLVISAVYLISAYARRHEVKEVDKPSITETQKGSDGKIK